MTKATKETLNDAEYAVTEYEIPCRNNENPSGKYGYHISWKHIVLNVEDTHFSNGIRYS